MNIFMKLGAIWPLLILCSCDEPKVKPISSTNVAALQALIAIPISIKAVRWEVFRYPEETEGFLPNNYESTTLVAEISPPDPKWLEEKNKPIEINWTSRNAVRPWLTPTSQAILATKSLDLTKHKCKHFSTTLVRSTKPVTGFTCESDGQVLLYLLLDEQS
jgi:hypothetical protein